MGDGWGGPTGSASERPMNTIANDMVINRHPPIEGLIGRLTEGRFTRQREIDRWDEIILRVTKSTRRVYPTEET
jgi:hypothetical protein